VVEIVSLLYRNQDGRGCKGKEEIKFEIARWLMMGMFKQSDLTLASATQSLNFVS
jgi:hypothetical protein